MLSYQYVSEELNKRLLRVMHTMLLAYIMPLWLQLIYMGEATGDGTQQIVIWNQSFHPVTIMLLVENLTMVAYVLVIEIVQERVRNFWLYTCSHVVCILAMWFTLQNSSGRIPRLIVCMVLMVCAFYARIQETHLGYPAIGWLSIGILMVLTGGQAGLHDMQSMGCVVEIASALLYVMYLNVQSLEHALQHNKGAGGIPYDKVRQTNLVVMTIWIVMASGLILAILLSGIGNHLFEVLGNGLHWCIRKLAQFIVYLLSLLPQSTGETYQETANMIDELDQGALNPVTSILMIIMMAIWETLVALHQLLAIVLIIWLVVQFSKWLYHEFNMSNLEEHQHVTWQRTKEKAVWIPNHRSKGLSPFDPAPAARIRRAYIQFIRTGAGFGRIQDSMTPQELMTVSVNRKISSDRENVIENSKENYSEEWESILHIYEKARYMPSQCSMQDVRTMHHAIRTVQKAIEA